MKIMKKTLLGVGAVSALAIAFAALKFDWHLDLMRENPGLFLKTVLNAFILYGSSAFTGGVLLVIATRNSWVKRFFNEWLLFVVFFVVGLCLIMVCDMNTSINIMDHKIYREIKMMKCRKAAERGDANAQYRLGSCYSNGYGVETNEVEAVRWYRMAAEQGHAGAQGCLGMCYANGDGVETNKAEAVKWYRKAAEQGEGHAQFWLGMFYYFGDGVNQNKEEATKWFDAIQEQDPLMQYACGCNFLEVKGIAPELTKEAVKWFRKAAEQGEAHAQFMLGMCYFNGVGITQDKTEAVKWLQKAAKQGHEKAKKALTEINNPEKPACPSDLLEPQSDRQDKTFPKVVTLGQTNTIRDVRQDKTLRAAALFAGAMRGKTPRARAGKGLLGIGALALSTWLHHKADENRKEAERLRKEAERLNEERWNEIRRKLNKMVERKMD